ncbi:hypothetical protein [Sphingomonas sp. 2SG]|uniref:hypothetical protein n=1 Tax=Sphingomonas sp. 2SG TaxID=2502201 RepID=UPI0010FA19D3|nr:hypothetical protein [Sphingomonas sp. 2SG]
MTQRLSWLILILAAVALRLPDIGNPLIDVDEQMYLLVGQRMWEGAIPYVDIWDRKPIGLFLIAAAARGLPGDPVVAYHLLALAAAAATAGLIATMARRHAGAAGALVAGLLYFVWLELLGGRGGQSPVFYDLAIVAAAMLTRDTIAGRRRAAIPAMLLAGIALQIKPTAVFEGCFFGVALLGATWHRHRNPARLAAAAALYAASALLPTIAAAAAYAGMGHGGAWWFATIESIFLRQATPGDPIAARLAGVALVLLVPAGLAIRGLVARPDRFLTGWLAVAVVGWLLVPPYFNHYALPLLLPIAVCAAAALDRRAMQALAAVAGGALLVFSGYPHRGDTADTRQRVATLARVIDRMRGQGCLFLVQAPPALYDATESCLPTRYPFPFHLVEASEARAIGIDPTQEVARILAARPPVIAIGDIPRNRRRPGVILVHRALARHYRAVARELGVTVYRRMSAAAPPARSGNTHGT